MLDDVVTACWHIHERAVRDSVREEAQTKPWWANPRTPRRTTDPSLQSQGSSDIQWQAGRQITDCEEQTPSRFSSEELQPLCSGVKPIKMELLSASPLRLKGWDTVWDAGEECFLGLSSICNEVFKGGTEGWKRRGIKMIGEGTGVAKCI